jgi:hypothetical protein
MFLGGIGDRLQCRPNIQVNTMMTQQQVISIIQLDTKAHSHDKFEQNIEEKVLHTVPFALGYTFDYDRFAKSDLQAKAKSTLGNFFGFVRQTFDGLIEIGRSLQDFYFDCLAFCPNGKKVFSEWLASPDFGASRYIAQSAMEISAWFDKLPAKVQRLVRQNVMSKRQDDFWVLLDHTIAQGMEVKHLLKPHQIELETQQPIAKTTSQELFTAAQVEQKVADAIAQHNHEKAEFEQGRFVEIRDAALQAAKREIQAAQEHAISAISFANAMEQAKQELIQQLATKEDEVRSLHALQTRNQQLKQRVAELEKALKNSSANNWDNTFNNQAAKVVNSELEKTIEPLMSEVERLNNVLSQKEQEIVQLQTSDRSVSDAVLAEFGEIGERFGWSGWSRRGYRAASGMLCTGISAIRLWR